MRLQALFAGALAVGLLLLAGTSPASLAKEKQTVAQGMKACSDWCIKHNKPGNSRVACQSRCIKYWECNGSDAIQASCEIVGGTWTELQQTPGGTTGLRRNLPLSTTPLVPAQ